MNSRYIYFRNELFPSSKRKEGRGREDERGGGEERDGGNKEKWEEEDGYYSKKASLLLKNKGITMDAAQWHEARPSNKIKLASI